MFVFETTYWIPLGPIGVGSIEKSKSWIPAVAGSSTMLRTFSAHSRILKILAKSSACWKISLLLLLLCMVDGWSKSRMKELDRSIIGISSRLVQMLLLLEMLIVFFGLTCFGTKNYGRGNNPGSSYRSDGTLPPGHGTTGYCTTTPQIQRSLSDRYLLSGILSN
jgi:hypothetical protein